MAASFFAVYALGKVTVEHPEGRRLFYPDQVPVAVLRPRSLKGFRDRQMRPRPMRS